MARFLKNPEIAHGALGVRLPLGTSALSDAPVDGIIRFNQTNSKVEFYYNGAWNQIAKVGSVQITVDEFVGDGLNQVFVMSQSESDARSVMVFIGGVYQQPTLNYSVAGTAITFTSAPPAPGVNPNKVVVIHNLNSTNAA
jgi:hypothetical protein